MFRSRITLEEYLKSVQHEDAAGEDVSLDGIDMIPDLEEEEVEHVGENIFESRVLINMNPSLINIPDNFKDDKEGKFLLPDGVQVNQKILKSVGERVRGFKYSLRCKYVKEDTIEEALYNLEKRKRPSAVGDQIWVGLVDYFFSEKFQNNEVYIKDAGQIENTTVLRDKGEAAYTSRSPHVLNQVSQQRRSTGGKENMQPNSLQGVNKSCTTQIGKKHISATNRMQNSTIGMPRLHNFVNQSYD
ncbi:hypothetical protein Cgig2_013919 [Carnegiea gigantea]|uniref:Uncharacterized protein n=1 Tax=Carnegiea gigantea TaxID=171969 RepID=A0A9Q1GVZ4_9CARY|nr:hypothetical protein Cgig2_013919 [Carnegiea gigantea]